MEPQSNNGIKKIIVLVVCVLFVAFGIYYFLFNSSAPQQVTLDQFGNPVASKVVGQDLLDLLNQLGNVKLDDSVFHEEAFMRLTDDAVTLPAEPRGRNNPFAPIGSSASGVSTVSNTQPTTRLLGQ